MKFPAAICAASLVTLSLSHANPPSPDSMAGKLIEHYQMQLIPQEGAWYSQTYASEYQIDGAALHRLQTDEVWHFYGGAPLDMLLLYPDGHGRKVTIGPNVLAGEFPQFTVPRGVRQAAAPNTASAGTHSFAGTQLSPGFDYGDFEIGYRDELQRKFPQFSRDIERLTRAEFASRPPAKSAIAFGADGVPAVTVSNGVDLRELVGRVARNARTSEVSVAQYTLAPPGNTLIFYAISAPAFSPDDYVAVKP